MTIHHIFCLPDILHYVWHHTSVSLADIYIKYHLSALSARRIITS